MDIITKNTPTTEAQEILSFHGIGHSFGWEIVMGMLLSDCDYIEVHGFSSDAYFVKVN